ncbi:hypothetical protein ABZT34_31905 [Streptomyces sp. NPDC005329]|uniref:LysM peptidoglycan-binding domain-containing protein n=1 Tax=Streptomyces sp. NPDC005329 TaxID=3157034 RepID=UPI0033ADF651
MTPIAPVQPPTVHTQPVRPQQKTTPKTCATHRVVSGDNLWNIATKNLGDPTKWTAIYDASQSVIETAAQTFGHSTSEHGDLIFPGSVVTVPGGASCTPATPQKLNAPATSQPELPKVQFQEAGLVCGLSILKALGKEALARSLKADKIKPPLIPEGTLEVIDIAEATKGSLEATIMREDGSVETIPFDIARAVADWASFLPGEPGAIAKVGAPALVCAQAAFAIDQQLAIRLGAQIRRALGLDISFLQEPTQ